MIGFRETTLGELALDHQVEVDTLTGSARLTVEVRTSSGREGFGPALELGYASGGGNSAYGLGWALFGIPSISLETRRRLPSYRADQDRYVFAGDEELVPYRRRQESGWVAVVDQRGDWLVQRYRTRIERSFERFEKWAHRATGRVHWLRFGRGGEVSVFGAAADGSTRIADPADPDRRTFQWLLEAQYEPKGNAIRYEYKPEDAAGVDATVSFESDRLAADGGFAQRYLKRVRYGNSRPLSLDQADDPQNQWCLEAVLDYGEHGGGAVPPYAEVRPWPVRADPFSSYRPGFEVRTWRLCRRILMFHRFPELGPAPRLVGATELQHREDPAGSVLERIGHRGYRTDLATGAVEDRAVPPITLRYSEAEPRQAFEAAPSDARLNGVLVGLDGAYQWIDLANEGLLGILAERSGAWYFGESLGGGRFGPLETVTELPSALSTAFRLQDFDGDGNIDLVGFQGREAGFYERDRGQGRWRGFQPFEGLPRVDLAGGRAHLLDLDGDGHAEVTVDHGGRLVWYPSEGTAGFGPAVEAAKPSSRVGGAPPLVQDRQLGTFLADMNGDDLLDLVRVGDGRVEYWPNLGHGRFGPPVLMGDSPVIGGFGQLDPERVRLVDLDARGTADLLYLDHGQVRCWSNQSGNRFGPERRLGQLPWIDRLSSAQVLDFLGDGTPCLVWSSPLPVREGQAVQYLRLAGELPPRLLVSIDNGAGRRTLLSWRSSARDYLRDKHGGRPWRSRLPQHTMVVGRIEGIDDIGGGRVATRYEYHDGQFDDHERRLIGFGLVDAYDTDEIRPGATAAEPVTPPSLVRSWYLTGAPDEHRARAADFYGGDPAAVRLPAPVLEDASSLTTEERLAGCRALAGMAWHSEVYAVQADGRPGPHPFKVEETCYRVRRLHPGPRPDEAAWTFAQSESLRHVYEQDPRDPRVEHDLLLDLDAYGDVARRVAVAYARRSGPGVRPEQRVLAAELTETSYTGVDAEARYEVGVQTQERRWALSGLSPPSTGVFDLETLRTLVTAALASPLGLYAAASGTAPQARLTGWERNVFWNADRTAALPAGQVGPVILLHHVERAALSEGDVAAAFDGRAGAAELTDGSYRLHDGFWWTEDATFRYRDRAAFHRQERETTPDGVTQRLEFDQHFLVVTATEDALGNRVESTVDYQALAAWRVRDANDNLAEVRYDPLGMAVVAGRRGQQLGSDGAAHPVGARPLDQYSPVVDPTAAAVLADPAAVVQGAGRFLFYDLWSHSRGDGPPHGILLEREQHADDGEGGAPGPGRVRVTITYLDGFGRPVQTKIRAGPGPAIQRDPGGAVLVGADGTPLLAPAADRWLTSGHDVLDHKGWLVRKYEPFFSTLARYEPDEVLRRYGVASTNHYDPLGRVIRQDLSDGTFTVTTQSAWATTQTDPNDNVVGSAWAAARASLPAGDPERQALQATLAHAGTPTIIEADPLGRRYRVVETGEGGAERVTTTVFGDLGLPERIVDPRGLTAFAYRHDMLGHAVHERSADSGGHWTLVDCGDRPVHRWDEQAAGIVHTRHRYDAEGRLVQTRVDGVPGPGHVVERVVYGDDPVVAQAALRNARGRMVEHFDQAGVRRFDRYDLDGEPLEVRRRLRAGYRGTADWSTPAAVALEATQHRTRTWLDGLGRVVRHTVPDGTSREYEYAPLGQVARVLVSTADGRLDRAVVADAMTHQARGQRTGLRLGNGTELSYTYDARTFRLARLSAARAGRAYLDVEYTYDPVGNVTRWVDHVQDPGAPAPLLQGLTASSACEFTYDPLYRLRTATGRVHQALLPHDYRTDGAPPGPVKGTRHLSLNNGAAVERYTHTYQYDLGDNLRSVRHQGQTRSWTTQLWVSSTSNRSLPAEDFNGVAIPDPESWFDPSGNTVRLPHLRAMVWDHANRLVQATIIERPGGQPDDAEYYVYDADGLRVRRVTERLVAGQVEVTDTTYLDGCELRRVSVGGATRLERRTSHLGDGSARLATLHQWSVDVAGRETDDVQAKRLHYLVGNHLGSVALELDAAGALISYEEYFPFGGTSFVAGDDVREVRLKEYRYCGKVLDDATGLYSFEYRYYAPWIGHWLSPDPLGPVDGPNLYCFVNDNPIRFVDAGGLQATELQIRPEAVPAYPPEVQARLDAEPDLRAAFDRGQVIFQPDANGGYTKVPYEEWAAWVRKENLAGRIPEIQVLQQPGAGEEASTEPTVLNEAELQELFRMLDELVLSETLSDEEVQQLAEELARAAEASQAKAQTEAGDGVEVGEKATAAHPADGSSDKGDTKAGKTGESGSNGNATTGRGAGAGGTADRPGQRGGTGTRRGAGRAADRAGPGTQGGRGERGRGPADAPPVPPGYRTGPGGLRYAPDLPPPPATPPGAPATGRGTASPTVPGADARGDPAADNGSGVRPQGLQSGQRGGQVTARRDGEERREQKSESWWDVTVRGAGYLNLVFDQDDDGEGVEGGIPGGLGLLGLHGTAVQVLYVVTTVISTIAAVWSIVKSVSLAALRHGFAQLVAAIRSPGAALRSLWGAGRAFWDETTAALSWLWGSMRRTWGVFRRSGSFSEAYRQLFRTGRWQGPLGWVTRLLKGARDWSTEQRWRDHVSFLFKPRLFGKGPFYNIEHIFPQVLGRNSPVLASYLNGYWNTFLRLPANFNSSLGARLGAKAWFYYGALEAGLRSWRLGQWIGRGLGEELSAAPGSAAAGGGAPTR